MWNEGDKVWFECRDANDVLVMVPCIVTGTFYEPGDPIQGVNLRNEITGEVYGGIDSQDCYPRSVLKTIT